MNEMNGIRDEYAPLTESVIAAAFEVSNTLGCGFLDKVYERALLHELHLRGLNVVAQPAFRVLYKDHEVGNYTPDLLVENVLLLELKCAPRLTSEHIAQALNYLRASAKPLCLLLNFHNPRLEWKRLKPRPAFGESHSSHASVAMTVE